VEVCDSVRDPKLVFFTDKALIHLSGYINAEIAAAGAVLIRDRLSQVPFHSWKMDVWCAITATQTAEPI
jgi:hypothetical protein